MQTSKSSDISTDKVKQRFTCISLFPEMFDAISQQGVIARAVKQGQIEIDLINPRDFTEDKHRTVDDRPYGGGPGMLMMVQPLSDAIAAAKAKRAGRVIYLSPQGRRLNQSIAAELTKYDHLILVAGRYEGIDERIIANEVDEEISLGDFVLSGGELAAMALVDAVSRLHPGVLGHDDSAVEDSFVDGLLDCPHYTRPEVLNGDRVPSVLLSGDHAAIKRWRMKQSLGRTWQRRPELLQGVSLTDEQRELLEEFQRETAQADSK
ncbi:MAG: tRNA (guanosine(37)-N1)-methyltransferase TrmD [Kangiellaceae bacterium]|jgi:tRNA (guanine37-N1)-methyltransferase|nr:tRNA (guanosine(37)-N1)-methyltransferase TrmD [Kangiellaceae bacterium]